MANVEISENTIGYEATAAGSTPLRPVNIYSLGFGDEELVTVYGALVTYLKVLNQQECPDLEAIERTARMAIRIKPQAVEASKSQALKAVGIEGRNADTQR